jgi:SAM-dependent methyltransferase
LRIDKRAVTRLATRRMHPEVKATCETAVQRHYDQVLGRIYSWTLGDFDARVSASAQLLEPLCAPSANANANGRRRAIDLGCGTGVQTLALVQLGFAVTGVDFSDEMLGEYRERTQGMEVNAVRSDIADFSAGQGFDVAVCFGDTVSHLQSWDAVASMFRCAFASLRAGGMFLLASRDHSRIYRGDERFLLIRADSAQSLTCFVEDLGTHVRVSDIVHRLGDADLPMTVSSYLKLRVSPPLLGDALVAAGFVLDDTRALAHGVHLLVAHKPE